jgi:hypothetical protein
VAGRRLRARELGGQCPGRGRGDVEPRGRAEKFTIEDTSPAEAIPVLRQYMRQVRVTRGYFDARPHSPDEAIAAELARHPVLRLSRPA